MELRARIWNYGVPRYPDNTSIVVVATIIDKAQAEQRDTVTLAGVDRYADLEFTLPLGKDPAEYTIRLQADPGRLMPVSYLVDNDTSFTFRVRGSQVLPIQPLRAARRGEVPLQRLDERTERIGAAEPDERDGERGRDHVPAIEEMARCARAVHDDAPLRSRRTPHGVRFASWI